MKTIAQINHRFGTYAIQKVTLDEAFSDIPENSFWLTDVNVKKEYKANLDEKACVIPAGEKSKSGEIYLKCLNWLAEERANRNATLVAFGGGVVGDLGGFVAATYMRGIRLCMIPTTFLAMIDSSVGGKVAIDLESGKNLAGAFYPPAEVRVCKEFLKSLPKREMRNGIAEALKYGFIMSPGILDLCSEYHAGDEAVLDELLESCILCKKEVVEEDEFETTGRRAILNFGHTIGHAIEAEAGFGNLLHGEAISIGMVVEAQLGFQLGRTPLSTVKEVRFRLEMHGLPTTNPLLLKPENLITRMQLDKKNQNSGFSFALLREIGDCRLENGIEREAIVRAIESTIA